MKRLVVAFLLLSAQLLQAQTLNVDSLKKALTNTTADSTRVFTLLRLGLAYMYSKPDTAMKFAQQAFAVADETDFVLGQTQSLNIIANLYFSTGNYVKALETHFKNLDVQEKSKNVLGTANTFNNIALIYQEQADFSSALNYYGKAKAIFKAANKKVELLLTYLNMGYAYETMNQLDSALFYENKAYQLGIQLKDQDNMGAVLANLGNIRYKQHNYTLALQQYRLSVPYATNATDLQTLGDAQYGIARIYAGQKLFDSAIYYAKQAMANYEEVSFPKGIASAAGLLSQLYEGKQQTDSAYAYFKRATATHDTMFNAELVRKVQIISNNEEQRKKEVEAAKATYRNRLVLVTALAALGILVVLSVVLYRNNRLKQKANAMLHQKNEEINLQRTKAEAALTELKSTQTQLIQREKMASLGELTAGIAHEIQNPLNFVNNFSETTTELAEELEQALVQGNTAEAKALATDIRSNTEKITHHGKRADSIVKGMLQHARASTGEKQLTDINKLADEYLRLSYQGMRSKDKNFNVTIETSFDRNVGEVNIVAQDLGRVLLNLFNNAFYAVNVKKQQLNGTFEPAVSVSTKRENNTVQIFVNDNGTGMSPKIVEKVFQPFFTTKPTGQGTGLGLSLSYEIVTKGHGGTLSVWSREGEGSEFVVTLPIL